MIEEHGFYHKDVGYWQTTNMPSEEVLASYPKGTKEIPLKPVVRGFDHEWNVKKQKWIAIKVEPEPEPEKELPPTNEQILAAIASIAKQAGLSAEQLDTALKEAGIDNDA